ncbi:hypothetical protein SUGI_0726670 [Cryptomeria japonica]|nr:hypothetical protein SUGI_0726670 [Cryptomeria japonica]
MMWLLGAYLLLLQRDIVGGLVILAAPMTDGEALLSFKRGAISSPDQKNGVLKSWNQSSAENPCFAHWEGISCDFRSGKVVSIGLAERNLSGIISPSLSSLPHLSFLNLSYIQRFPWLATA